jgi:hypothetical protein
MAAIPAQSSLIAITAPTGLLQTHPKTIIGQVRFDGKGARSEGRGSGNEWLLRIWKSVVRATGTRRRDSAESGRAISAAVEPS